METLIADVLSLPHPQKGQKHRSSGNFSTDDAAANATSLRFKIDRSNPNWASIHFDVKRDRSGGTDPTIYKDVYDGNKEPVERERDLYISDPEGADANFLVQVYQVRCNNTLA